jgi:predicted membrane protein
MTIKESSKLIQKQEPEIPVVPDSSVVAVPVEHHQSISSPITRSYSFNVTLCGDFKLRSTSIGKRNTYITLCGDHTLDLRRTQFPATESISIVIIKLCGDIRLIVPENVSVSTCTIMLCGDKRIEIAAGNGLSCPHVKLTIVKLCGNVIITNNDV